MMAPANIGQVLKAAQEAVSGQQAARDAAAAAAAAAPVQVPPATATAPPAGDSGAAGHG